MRGEAAKVVVYPSSNNPYQILLYRYYSRSHPCRLRFIAGPRTLADFLLHLARLSGSLIASRLRGYDILHVHWVYGLRFPGTSVVPPLSKAISTLQILAFLWLVRCCRFKLVWTVHDLVPLNNFMLWEKAMSQRLIKESSAIVLLAEETKDGMDAVGLTYDPDKTFVIPHGNYIDWYVNTISRETARKSLGIPESAFVFLFFGNIHPYKNVSLLIEQFMKISSSFPEAHLVIAGMTANSTILKEVLAARENGAGQIIADLNYVENERVQLFYNAADIAVHPFRQITNSGSVLLSASFGKGVIAPRLGALKELPDDIGLFYQPDDAAGLERQLRQAISDRLSVERMGKAALIYAKSLSWEDIAEETHRVYRFVSGESL